MKEPCDECGWAQAGGRSGCRERFDQFLARDFSDALYFRSHRLFVDAYALQHPDQFCRSAKSLAAHLAGLAAIVETGASSAVGTDKLQRWLNGRSSLIKPALPDPRGATTIGDLPADAAPADWADAVRGWAETVWQAYAELHPVAREWLGQAARS